MSIIPISTNFTGIQKSFVPKCLLIDIYDLECILDDDTITEEINKIQTLAILSGGSIITNVSITSPKPILPTNPAYYYQLIQV